MKTFRDAIREKDFVLTAQFPLTPGSNADDVRQMVETLRATVDAVQIDDNTTTRPHMSPLAAATLVLRAGMDPIVQMSCRDRNRIALQSDLMGAAALGVTSLVLTRGEKLPSAHKQRIKGVFDIGAQRLLATALAVSASDRLLPPPGFFAGSNVTVIDPPANWSADGIDSKATAGSQFVQTQPCLDFEILQKYMAALVAKKALERISVILQVPLFDSMEMIAELHNGRRPLLLSSSVRDRLYKASNFAAESESVCVEALQQAAKVPGVSGANILHRGDPAVVVRVATAAFPSSQIR